MEPVSLNAVACRVCDSVPLLQSSLGQQRDNSLSGFVEMQLVSSSPWQPALLPSHAAQTIHESHKM